MNAAHARIAQQSPLHSRHPLEGDAASHPQRGDPPLDLLREDIARGGLYNPDLEHDACGTGFVAEVSGERTRRVVELAVEAVINLTHRGAVSADAASGDGAGVTIEVPFELLQAEVTELGHDLTDRADLAVAMCFLP
ncbi:MAG: hypothetical protein OXC56_02095, partial [Chloroflexi bacterium]|nr:hypothetical protein [Chloroflexota bacterium]